jgi:hypothetical protein
VTERGSLDVIEEYVRRELDAEERRADAVDGKAGLVLGFAGVLVSLGPGFVWAPLALAARVVAGLAGLLAVLAFRSRTFPSLDLAALRQELAAKPDSTRLLVVNVFVGSHGDIRARLERKVAHLRRAVWLLILAVALALLGSTVEVLHELVR